MSVADAPPTRVRGSDAVKTALIEAAASMLGEVGPRGISVRDVAERAGVNHGQVHHYFGGKRGLLKAAMAFLARKHFDHARQRSEGSVFPPILSLAEDTNYSRALCQSVMEGDLELASIEIEEGVSAPRHILRALQDERGAATTDLEIKAQLAMMAAMQLGWAAFEDFILLLTDVDAEDRDSLRDKVKEVMQAVVDGLRR
jgi:AcrR family transcriptional regulator